MQRPGEAAAAHRRYVRNSTKVIVILGLSFLFLAIENALDGVVPVSGLLAVVSMACVLKRRSVAFVSKRLSDCRAARSFFPSPCLPSSSRRRSERSALI